MRNASQSAEAVLREKFGLPDFRPAQRAIVDSVLSGGDNLVIMPTGGGKSLCYQLPAMMLEGVALVVSPLIALMKDQVDALTARGIPATLINSSLTASEQGERIRGIGAGQYRLVYIAPERFRSRYFVDQLRRVKLSFVAVDEAHCVSQWGHDFRPDYLRVGEAVTALGGPPVNAFTATATPEVQEDIQRALHMRDPQVFVTGFARPNLHFRVEHVAKQADKYALLSRLIAQRGTGIVYCATRKRVEEVAERLEEWEIPYVSYHGGMNDEERESLQNRFINREVDVAVATNAFGMGIDRSDLRFIAHYEIPGSIEAYYQEAGRAGRDGKPGECVLFYNYADRRTQDFFIDGANPGASFIRELYHQLLEVQDAQHEIRRSIQELSEIVGCKNSMMISSSLKALSDAGVVERFDVPGERIRGTRLLQPNLLPFQVPLDDAALAEKERRDRAKLDSMIAYATGHGCRQRWMQEYFGEKVQEDCGRCDECNLAAGEGAQPLNSAQTLFLRKLLSGVARMSEGGRRQGWEARFGKGLILQMLMGSEEQRINQFGLQRLSTYGIFRDESPTLVKAVFESALRSGMLTSTGGIRPLVTLTAKGDAVMREEEVPVMIWPSSGRKRAGKPGGALRLSGGAAPEDLVDALKKKRAQLAKARGNVPPYQILTNRALEALAASRPESPEEALAIPGIGPAKARSVVPAMLKVIGNWQARSG
jgi:ATP-dependent DNA helicase RecQ